MARLQDNKQCIANGVADRNTLDARYAVDLHSRLKSKGGFFPEYSSSIQATHLSLLQIIRHDACNESLRYF